MTWGAALAKTWGLPAAPTLLRLPRATDVFWGAGAALRLRFVGVLVGVAHTLSFR